MKKYVKLSFVAVFFVICGLVYSCDIPAIEENVQLQEETVVIETMTQGDIEVSDTIYVYICGEIAEPGVYEMRAGSRMYELVKVAGGFTDKAASESLNLAQELYDTQMITVWSVDDMVTVDDWQTGYDDGLVNINTANIDELTSLPGIGDVRAQDIISYREKNGSFSVPEDIMKVPGIKEHVYEKIKDLITAA